MEWCGSCVPKGGPSRSVLAPHACHPSKLSFYSLQLKENTECVPPRKEENEGGVLLTARDIPVVRVLGGHDCGTRPALPLISGETFLTQSTRKTKDSQRPSRIHRAPNHAGRAEKEALKERTHMYTGRPHM